jgi:hypothetical protein
LTSRIQKVPAPSAAQSLAMPEGSIQAGRNCSAAPFMQ